MADNKAQIVIGAENRAEGVLRQVRTQLGGLAGDANITQRAFGGLGVALTGALSGAGLAAFFKSTADGLDRLNDVADVTGATIENISALEDVAARTGTTIETVEGALVKLNLQLSAADGKNGVSQAFKQIGLDAEQLKKVDPAEALRLTSVALGRFADDGDKARLVQELFGKSVREVGPLLKDLATQTKLTATVTAEQTREAEKVNQQLAALQKNATDAARGLASVLIPALNEYFENLRKIKAIGGVASVFFGTDEVSQLESRATQLNSQVSNATDTVLRLDEALKRDPGSEILSGRLEKARVRLESLRKQAASTSEQLKAVADNLAPPDRSDALSRRLARGEGGPVSVGPIAIPGKSGAAKQRGIEGLPLDRTEAFRQSELATQALVDEALATAKLSSAEAVRQSSLKAIAAEQERLNQLISATPTAAFERQQDDIQFLRKAFEDTRISVEQYAEAVAAVSAPTKQLTSDIDEFAKQASRNIQDQLGQSLYDAATGNFKDIGDEFSKLLLRIATEAVAADLGKKLFGASVQGGSGSGWVGLAIEGLSAFFGGGRADGGEVRSGMAYLVGEEGPELFKPRGSGTILPAQQTASMMGKRTLNVTNNFVISGPTTKATQEQIASAALRGAQAALARNG